MRLERSGPLGSGLTVDAIVDNVDILEMTEMEEPLDVGEILVTLPFQFVSEEFELLVGLDDLKLEVFLELFLDFDCFRR